MNISRLKEIRKDRDITQTEVAKYLGMKQQQYSEYEIGKRLIPVETLDKLADFYNTSIDYLVGRTDERKAYRKSILK
ncbi:helix-turn-helix domain protein [Mycoplasma sp. CAG:776]|nr:helix-turn-helix domain protein [Mycoplasma sp. CAG:776]